MKFFNVLCLFHYEGLSKISLPDTEMTKVYDRDSNIYNDPLDGVLASLERVCSEQGKAEKVFYEKKNSSCYKIKGLITTHYPHNGFFSSDDDTLLSASPMMFQDLQMTTFLAK